MRVQTAARRGTGESIALPPARALLGQLLPLLALAVAGEVVLFRVVSRVGVHIPKDGAVLTVYGRLTQLGSFSFNLATLLAGAAMVLAALTLFRGGRAFLRNALLPGWLLTIVGESALFAALPPSETRRLLFGVTAAAGLALVALAARRQREVVWISTGAFLLAAYYTLSNLGAVVFRATATAPFSQDAVRLGEALVPVAALTVFVVWGPPLTWRAARRHPWVYGLPSLLTLAVAAAFFGPGSTSSILSLWTTGLSLYLPLPLYILALWMYGVAFAHSVATGRHQVAAALVLLFAAGLSLETTYQYLLAMLALLILGDALDSPADAG